MSTELEGFYAIIPAGGAGSRLWPLSRAGSPKFLHDVAGTGTTLLRGTWERLVPLTGPDRIVVVTGEAHAVEVAAQLPQLPGENTLLERSGRDSATAIGLAAAILERRHPGAVIGSFAADHLITNPDRFRAAVREAVHAAEAGFIVTIGIQPVEPSTAFGYIRAGRPLPADGAPSARRVDAFVEKPSARTARRYLASGEYLWNAGIFVAKARRLIDELERNRPELASGIGRLADAWDGPERAAMIDEVWPTLEKVAIDYAVAEPAAKAGALAVIPGYFGWDDVGDFAAISRLHPDVGGDGELRVIGDASGVVGVDAGGLVVHGTDRVIAVAGIEGAVVVDTPDALLVTTRDHAQLVKQVVEKLKTSSHPEVL